MSKTIEGVPDSIDRADYCALLAAYGFDPSCVQEIRFAHDGIHALVFEKDDQGHKILCDGRNGQAPGYRKHRIFVPIKRSESDARTKTVKPVNP